jgi:hypothetical protein
MADIRRPQPVQPVARQVEQVAVVLPVREEALRIGIFGKEGGEEFRPDLVGALADAGADDGVTISRAAPSASIASSVASSTPASAPRQPAWTAPTTPAS